MTTHELFQHLLRLNETYLIAKQGEAYHERYKN